MASPYLPLLLLHSTQQGCLRETRCVHVHCTQHVSAHSYNMHACAYFDHAHSPCITNSVTVLYMCMDKRYIYNMHIYVQLAKAVLVLYTFIIIVNCHHIYAWKPQDDICVHLINSCMIIYVICYVSNCTSNYN